MLIRTRLLTLMGATVIIASTGLGQFNWTRSTSNPVVRSWTGYVNDPNYLYYAFEPTVMYDSAAHAYRMWHVELTNIPGAAYRICTAISPDGVQWYTYAKNPVFNGGPSNALDTQPRAPRVIYDGSQYKMYYLFQSGDFYGVGLATSADGLTWHRYPDSTTTNPSLFTAITAWCDVSFDSAKYTMWFSRGWPDSTGGTVSGIGRATSADGLHWTEYAGNPVFTAVKGSWDSTIAGVPAVVRASGTYYMYYIGSGDLVTFSVGLATSPDGIHWTRAASKPVMSPQGSWEGSWIGALSVLFRNNTFMLWYNGYAGSWQIGTASAPVAPLAIGPSHAFPSGVTLEQNYPNPFNPGTTIRYTLVQKTPVRLALFNALGQVVKTLVNAEELPGEHEVKFDGSALASGVYFYRLQAGTYEKTMKLVLLR